MSHKKLKKSFAVLLAVLMVLTAFPLSTLAIEFKEVADGNGIYLVADTKTPIAPGITENKIITNDQTNSAQVRGYAVTVDPNETTVGYRAGYTNMEGEWKMTTVRAQAAACERKYGENVVVAINADIFNMATGEPTNVLVMNGKVYKAGLGGPYVGTTKDGEFVMGNKLTQDVLDNLQEAVGGFYTLLENGKRVHQDKQPMLNPKTAIGKRENGEIVFYVADGRDYPNSNGLSDYDLTTIMLGLGCVDVINLDGGGSATYLAKVEGSDSLALRSKPSDGVERSVSSSFFITSSAKPTGVFDHANLEPNNEIYTPYSVVDFSATGVDSSGTKTELPADGTYALAADSESLGSITANGVFTSNGETGTVTVNYVSEGKVCGSTSIEVQNPDTMYFSDEEVSLGFEAESTLGLVVKYKGIDVNYKAEDIKFVLSNQALGHFEGLTFISSPSETTSGTITAIYAHDESLHCSITAIIGKLPTLVWDFEDVEEVDEEGNVTTIPASEYYIGSDEKEGILTHSNYGRGGNESIEIVSIDDEEPVRFGSHSLKLNYDFINCGAVTEGACVGTTESMTIPGNPTAIGVWVYAPEGVGITYTGEGQAGFWLRGYVYDGKGTNQPFDFNLEPSACVGPDGKWNGVQPGISWEGWMYCEADLTKFTGPFSVMKGMTFRLMYVDGTHMGTKTAGSVYFDNLQFVYGTNIDDVDNPVIDSITVNNEVINDGDVITTNTVTFDSYFHDVENKYTTGVDASTVRMYIDGVNTADNEAYQFVAEPDGTKSHLYDVYLLNGQHSITVTIRDGFGNETSETRYFTVKGEEADVPTVTVAPAEDSAVIGKTISLEIKASDASAITDVMTGITVGKQFRNYEVSFADGFSGTYKHNKLTDVITVNAEGSAKDGNDVIATVTFDIPETLNASAEFSYTVKAGSYTVDGTAYTYSAPAVTVPVTAAYVVTADPIIVGEEGTLHVETADGKPAAGITLYYEGDTTEELGKTDENGDLVTSRFSSAMGNYIVYAKDDEGLLSFRITVGSYDANGETNAPYGIMSNATKDPSSTQSITWMSNPKTAGKQTIEYRAEGSEDDWTTIDAKSKKITFTKGSNSVVSVNSVVLEGLEAGTTYEYTVGGEERSEVKTFSTTVNGADTSFFVLGDVQADDLTNINAITNIISGKDYDFGIQTGDAVDDTTSYRGWVDATDFLGADRLGGTDVIHVLGNHEYSGDANAERAKSYYALENSNPGGYYSVTYGNVYVAVINYSGSASQYRAALDWMVKDAKASDAQWKILSIHQPAYYTNISTGGNSNVHALVPAAAEEAGIDAVFSGHDHAYARTKPMIGGEVNEDGVVYFIAGSSGEKSYTAVNSPEFNFEMATNDYTSIYMSITATKDEFSVNTYDISVNNNGSVNTVLYDSYSILSQCKKYGHEWFHDSETDAVTCSVCDEINESYTGFVRDSKTDRVMYFTQGNKATGWFVLDEDAYYFDENGLGVTGKVTIDGITYTFTQDSVQSAPVFHKDADGETRCYVAGEALHGWQFIDGYYYYFSASSGRMLVGTFDITFRLGDKGRFTFDKNGRLTSKTVIVTTKEGLKQCYYGPELLTGWQTIDGTTYYFDADSGIMVTGETLIDGKIFAFSNDGAFLHEGAHIWNDDTCTICRMNKDGSFSSSGSGFFGSILDWFRRIINSILNFFRGIFS